MNGLGGATRPPAGGAYPVRPWRSIGRRPNGANRSAFHPVLGCVVPRRGLERRLRRPALAREGAIFVGPLLAFLPAGASGLITPRELGLSRKAGLLATGDGPAVEVRGASAVAEIGAATVGSQFCDRRGVPSDCAGCSLCYPHSRVSLAFIFSRRFEDSRQIRAAGSR